MNVSKLTALTGAMVALAFGVAAGVALLGQPEAEAQTGSAVTVIMPAANQQGVYIVGCANGTVMAIQQPRLYESRRVC
ncbi:hypothetical protein [Maricaulis sp.]|uniref:hypothetical protein n=1 Tax=Maricaulis sp. TaxID=1486257 RepID=UPI0026133DF5|nr:hypothetical protein [Maricaulis sp.]